MTPDLLVPFLCWVTVVQDGNTFACSNGTRVLLAGIEALDIEPCPQAPCTPGDAKASRAALQRLVLHRNVRCWPVEPTYYLIAAWCRIGDGAGLDVSCEMVQGGWAIARSDDQRRLCRW